MMGTRVMSGTFRHAPEFERRNDMIEATLDCIADQGIEATTVRAVAARAGVSNGLIRHHFATKDNLIKEAYRRTIDLMTRPALEVAASGSGEPEQRLVRFVEACLSGQVADPRLLSVWATFISQVHYSEQIAKEHHAGYANFRRATERIIKDVLQAGGRQLKDSELEYYGIVVNALIDGIWLEGCLADDFDATRQIGICLKAIEAMIGVELPASCKTGK